MLTQKHLAREGTLRLLRSHHVSPTQRPTRPPAPPGHHQPHASMVQSPTIITQQQQQNVQGAAPTSAYIHLPFCKRKCWYCDFPVQAVGSKLTSSHIHDRMVSYVEQICQEVNATPRLGDAPLQTVYFGGGTPSLVPPSLVGRILDTLDKRYGISSDAEVSMEADPGTFDLERLQAYIKLGVNRLSMGVQSFQQELLQACGRSHSIDDVYKAIDAVHASGIGTWSLDLISGLPHLTRERWQESLDLAIKANPTHISVYDLQVEEGTPFARWYSPGRRPLPADEDAAFMYAMASQTLTSAGYEHYEVSNYARPGHRSRHNQVYWVGTPYYAFGQGAASYLGGRRFTRPSAIKAYTAWLEAYVAGGREDLPGIELPPQTQEDRMLENIMLRLRTADGLDLDKFAHEYGNDMAALARKGLARHITAGRVLVATKKDDKALFGDGTRHVGGAEEGLGRRQDNATPGASVTLRLSDPDGFLMSNDIISDVFAVVSGS